MNYTLKVNKEETTGMLASETKLGDLMTVREEKEYEGQILLHTYSGIVSLSDPEQTWGEKCILKVRVLQPGEQVILTVK